MNTRSMLHPNPNTAIKFYFSACLLFIAFFINSPVYALTTVLMSNYQRLDIKIARNDLTHIVVKHDRIQQVRGLKGRYFLDRDDQTGSIYLLPTPAYQKKAFSIFIITHKGKTYTLRCTPTDQPADTILLTKKVTLRSVHAHLYQSNRRRHTMTHRKLNPHHPTGKHAHYHAQKHKKSHKDTYQRKNKTHQANTDFSKPSRINELTRLLKAMMKHRVINGYAYRHHFIVHHYYLADKALKVWIPLEYLPRHGRQYQGQFLIVKNNTQHTVVLTPDLFKTDQTDVLAIKEPLLKPQAQTYVYHIQRFTPDSTK